jgi:putative transcriptional regulator
MEVIMINIRIAEIMGRRKLTKKAVADLTGIRPNTIGALWQGTVKRLELDQLNELCRVLECQPGELFEYVPDAPKNNAN